MKKISVLITLSLLLLAGGCSPCRLISKYADRCLKIKEKTDTIIRDTTIINYTDTVIKPDSSIIRAYLECDSNNNVIIKQINEYKGQYTSTTLRLKNNVLYIKSLTDSIKTLNKTIERLRYQSIYHTIIVKDTFEIKELQKKLDRCDKKAKKISLLRNILFLAIIILIIAIIKALKR